MTINRHGSATLKYPSDREMLTTRKFDASAELLFDVLTKPEQVTVWFTGGDEVLEVCKIDLRVGGEYRYVGVIAGGDKCSFYGTFLEIERPTRFVDSWVFHRRPEAEAVETVTLREEHGVTTMTTLLAFKDQSSRDSMFEHAPEHRDDPAVAIDGQQASFDKVEDHLASLL